VNEQEARKVFSHAIAMCKVFGGDIRQMCAQRGVPDDLISKLLAEQNLWDKGLGRFDWDGSVIPAQRRSGGTESDTNPGDDQRITDRRQEERTSVSIPATFTLENNFYTCVVLNKSTSGLLLRFVQQPGQLSKDGMGKNGTVVFGIGEESKRSPRGKIIRVLLRDNGYEAAVSVIPS